MTVNAMELPLVIVQTPEVQKLHDMVRTSPEAQQAAAGRLLEEQQKRARSSVPQLEKTEKSTHTEIEERQSGSSGQGYSGQGRKNEKQEDENQNVEHDGILDIVV